MVGGKAASFTLLTSSGIFGSRVVVGTKTDASECWCYCVPTNFSTPIDVHQWIDLASLSWNGVFHHSGAHDPLLKALISCVFFGGECIWWGGNFLRFGMIGNLGRLKAWGNAFEIQALDGQAPRVYGMHIHFAEKALRGWMEWWMDGWMGTWNMISWLDIWQLDA